MTPCMWRESWFLFHGINKPISRSVFCSAGYKLHFFFLSLCGATLEVIDTKFDRKKYNFLQRCKIICNETTCCSREQRLWPVWHDQRSPSRRYLYDQHHHLSVAVFHTSKFWTSICTFSSPSLPLYPAATSIFSDKSVVFFWKKTADNLFSKADCSKLSPVINEQRGRGRARLKERDSSSLTLIGTTSHTEVSYHSHRQQPCFTWCLAVPCFFPLLRSVCARLQHAGQSVAQLSVFVTSCFSPLKLMNIQSSPN